MSQTEAEQNTIGARIAPALAAILARQPPLADLSVAAMRLHAAAAKRPWNDRPRPWLSEQRDSELCVKTGRPVVAFSTTNSPAAVSKDRPILWIHGGGWSICTIETHRALLAELARVSGRRVYAIHPRQAPEHPYPAPLDDVTACCAALAERYPGGFHLGGDSAGANLALGAAQRQERHGRSAPFLSLVLAYGCFRARFDTESHARFGAGDYGLSTKKMRAFWRLYGGARQPHADFADGALAPMPPCQCHAAACDPLLDDTLWLVDRLSDSTHVDYRRWAGMTHGFLHFTPELDIANEAISAMSTFMDRSET